MGFRFSFYLSEKTRDCAAGCQGFIEPSPDAGTRVVHTGVHVLPEGDESAIEIVEIVINYKQHNYWLGLGNKTIG